MMLEIPGLLNEAQIGKIKEILDRSEFVDGKLTAGTAAERVKNNQELKKEPRQMELLNHIIVSSLARNAAFSSAALPYRMADLIFARYQPGMAYGDHVDDPIMGNSGPRFRTDISMTIFINAPESYEGGELVVRTTFGEKRVKLAAGDAVIYPSSSLHHVAEVTKGERLVALSWVQSHVRDPARRELLYELNQVREHLLRKEPDAESTGLIDKSYANLMRMWAEV